MREDPSSLEYVPDWFVTQGQAKIWDDVDDYATIMNLLSGTMVIRKRKAQKAQIKEEFLLIAWHPYRVMDWCVSEDEKKETEKLWS